MLHTYTLHIMCRPSFVEQLNFQANIAVTCDVGFISFQENMPQSSTFIHMKVNSGSLM